MLVKEGDLMGLIDPMLAQAEMNSKIAKLEGIPVGISSGATIAAALEIGARPEMKGKLIVVIAASSAERYLSTDLFAE